MGDAELCTELVTKGEPVDCGVGYGTIGEADRIIGTEDGEPLIVGVSGLRGSICWTAAKGRFTCVSGYPVIDNEV